MAFEGYGGYVWSDEPAPSYNSFTSQGLSLAVAAGVGATAFAGAAHTRADGTRLLDTIADTAQYTGNMTPFQFGNTFRIPEFLSPFTSAKRQGLTDLGDGKFGYEIGGEFLENKSTQLYLKELTGLSDPMELAKHGLGVNATSKIEKLTFERTADSARGSLFSVVDGERRLLSKDVMLQQFTPDTAEVMDVVEKSKSVNRAAYSYAQAMDMWSHADADGKSIFNPSSWFATGGSEVSRPSLIPVPSAIGSVDTTSVGSFAESMARRTTTVRAGNAFAMERFNRLMGGMADTVLGQDSSAFLHRLVGTGAEVTPGPSMQMYGRFGAKVAGLGALAIGVSQVDWARRNFGAAGEVAASGAISGGLAYTMDKMNFSGQTSMMMGVASFFGQMVLPGFDQGVIPGIATSYARTMELRGTALNPVNYYRRTLEGFLPGISSPGTAALVGIGALGMAYGRDPFFTGKRLNQLAMDQFGGAGRFGIQSGLEAPPSVRDLFWADMYNGMKNQPWANDLGDLGDADTMFRRHKMEKLGGWHQGADYLKNANKAWAKAEDKFRTLAPDNPMNKALLSELHTIGGRYHKGTGLQKAVASFMGETVGDMASNAMMQAEGLAAQMKYGMFGAALHEPGFAKQAAAAGFKVPLGRAGLVFAGAAGAWSMATGGMFGSMESSGELRDIYSGKQHVEVGKSRWWEAGGTPFGGSKTSYTRPHAVALTVNRVREKGIWGADEDDISPIGKWFRKNFTYELERKTYYDRPYPISSAAFSDTPIIGGLLAATIGKIVKPSKIMHAGEWIRPGENGDMEFASTFEGSRREPSYELGAHKPGTPGSPFSPSAQAAFASYQFRELEGMTGWAKNVLQDIITGNDQFGTDTPLLAESGLMTSSRLRFWESSTGGGLFMNEVVRRILPSYRSEIERVNPIMNSMASWLPDKFRYGDPYRTVEWGEARLPGDGYEALHPELAGLDVEDYPDIYRYAVLADVAPFTSEFRAARASVYERRKGGSYSPAQEAWMDKIDEGVTERYNVYNFDHVDKNAIRLPGSGITSSISAYAQKTVRKAVAPAEYLVPMGFRPVQKLMGDRGAIERYEYERLYGTPMAFWDKPIRDWLRPSFYSAANALGFTGKPGWRKDADADQEYFDKLEFHKWMGLAEQARDAGDGRAASRYEYQASSTRYGVNPGGNPLSIYWSLPAEERAFFNAFSMAQGSERNRILEMIPEDQTHLYKAIWSRMDNGDPSLWAGGPTGADQRHLAQQQAGLSNYFDGQPLPPEDWIGYHEDIDMDDVRVRYLDEQGKDLHDYGLWESQLKQSMSQPFLDDSTQYLHNAGGIQRGGIHGNLYRSMGSAMQRPSLSVRGGSGYFGSTNFTYNDDRGSDIQSAVGRYLGG